MVTSARIDGMANAFQVTIDAASPRALGVFWCEVLGYVEQPPPPGFDNWDDALDAMGIDRTDPDRAYAIVDPRGVGPRVFFQKVPESKRAKNRVHLDVNVGKDVLHERADTLVAFGARIVAEFDEPGGHWITMLDPEGNEFCLQ
jgi:Glyoxalase-like domain